MKYRVSESNKSYIPARQTERGIVTPDGARIVDGRIFHGLSSGRPLAFVRRAIVPAGFFCPGGWGGAGSSEWSDDGAEVTAAGIVTVSPGSPERAARWYFEPADVVEDFAANAAAYAAAEKAERENAARQQAQKTAAIDAVVEIISLAWERELFCQAVVENAEARAKEIAPDSSFGSWHWSDGKCCPGYWGRRSAFGGTFPEFGRCHMTSMGTGRDVEILQAAIGAMNQRV